MKTIKETFAAAVVLGSVGLAGSYGNEAIEPALSKPLEDVQFTKADAVTCQQKVASYQMTADQNDPRYLRKSTDDIIKCLNSRKGYSVISWNLSR